MPLALGIALVAAPSVAVVANSLDADRLEETGLAEGPDAGCCAVGPDAGCCRCLDRGRDVVRPEAAGPCRRVSRDCGSSPGASQGCRCVGRESPLFPPDAEPFGQLLDWLELRPWRLWPLRVWPEPCSGSRGTSERAWERRLPSQGARHLSSCSLLWVVLGAGAQRASPAPRRELLLCLRLDVEESESERPGAGDWFSVGLVLPSGQPSCRCCSKSCFFWNDCACSNSRCDVRPPSRMLMSCTAAAALSFPMRASSIDLNR